MSLKHAMFSVVVGVALAGGIRAAFPQNNDNGGVMPLTVTFVAGGDGVGGIDVYSFSASYHGQPVTVGLVGDAAYVLYGGAVVGPLPLAVLDKLDGADNYAHVGTTVCFYTGANLVEVIPMPVDGFGASLSVAAGDFMQNVQEIVDSGYIETPCP